MGVCRQLRSVASCLADYNFTIQNVCDGQNPIAGYMPPACEQNRCGQCYQVTNQGGRGGAASGVGKTITIQIIDACPATNAWNFCKTDTLDLAQKCMDPGTNSLDIEQNAYTELTGQNYAPVFELPSGQANM